MKATFRTLISSAVLSACLTFAHQAISGPQIHVEGELTGTFTVSPPNPSFPGEFEVLLITSGQITNLGEVEVIVHGGVAAATDLSVTPIPPTTFVIIATNGDLIHGILHWDGETTAVMGVYDLAGDATLTGGTGIFKGIKGTGSGIGTLNLATGQTTVSISGNISTPKQAKKPKKSIKKPKKKSVKAPKEKSPKGPQKGR